MTNRGVGAIRDLSVAAEVPAGWTAAPATPARRARLATDATLETTWQIGVPADTPRAATRSTSQPPTGGAPGNAPPPPPARSSPWS
ncbi:NEW3 domain-containing protein [Nonomuraea thailandensis]